MSMKHIDETAQPAGHLDGEAAAKHKKALLRSRLAVLLGALAFGILYTALPEPFTLGPSWLPLALEIVIMLLIVVPYVLRHPLSHVTIRSLSFVLLAVVTVALIIGVSLLIYTLPHRSETQGTQLLRTAILLWSSNILVFALWYWELDGGGPHRRYLNKHQAADFMFPQQANGNEAGWAPHFVDYLFVAFTAATALSPTDTYPLTQRAKALMMIEAIIALANLAILAGRAVNIL